jgi:hypothetical protein
LPRVPSPGGHCMVAKRISRWRSSSTKQL